jgi:hypothetical protein
MLALIEVELITVVEFVITRGSSNPFNNHFALEPGSKPDPDITTSSVMFCGALDGRVDFTTIVDPVAFAILTEG